MNEQQIREAEDIIDRLHKHVDGHVDDHGYMRCAYLPMSAMHADLNKLKGLLSFTICDPKTTAEVHAKLSEKSTPPKELKSEKWEVDELIKSGRDD